MKQTLQLDRPVQVLDDVTEPTGNLKDHNLTYDVCSDLYLRGCNWAAGWLVRERGRDVCRGSVREQDDVVAEV